MAFLKGYTDEILLNEVDGMTDMLYEKQGSYLQGKEDCRNDAIAVLQEMGLTSEQVSEFKAKIAAVGKKK